MKNKALTSLVLLYLSANAAASSHQDMVNFSTANTTLAKQLGWVSSNNNNCGGYYLEQPFLYPTEMGKNNTVEITGNQGVFSLRGTSVLENKVSITRFGQQITAHKGYLYRDPITNKYSSVEMIGDVHLREPNTLVIAKNGRYYFNSSAKSLNDILYRTSLMHGRQIAGRVAVTTEEMQEKRKITNLTAWGKAATFAQEQPRLYDLTKASYSTCPPDTIPAWQVRASHIVLDKNSGRGYATHARILVKSVPIFYTPYINFPIDRRRKTGFLWPTFGLFSNQWGPYLKLPFYWNIAPNYDMTITPSFLSKRGVLLTDDFRYLTETSSGTIDVSVLPSDQFFAEFQRSAKNNTDYTTATNPVTQAEFNRLVNASTTRKGFFWRDHSLYNDHWSSNVDINYAGDDYYMKDFGNLNEVTLNQLLEKADLEYKGENWNFVSRVQAYQTLHPLLVNEPTVYNQYRRLPQLVLNGSYPDQTFGLHYFINNEAVRFDILKTPGFQANQPVGTRINTQPGISLPYNLPYFFITPRAQIALTGYNLYQTADTDTPNTIHRSVPIYDISSGLSFNRESSLFGFAYRQTLEPQVYYTYIPYRNQFSIPTFDTTNNTLTYDQIFNYNRFTGIDRIGDANQMGFGITSRVLNRESGLEKIRMGFGGIVYFANRIVTLCSTGEGCINNSNNHNNYQRLSPLTAMLDYHVNEWWSFKADPVLINPVTKQLDNTTVGLHFQPDEQRALNFGYTYARGGDVLSGIASNDPSNNLKVTDFSFVWPLVRDISAVGRWSQNWNHAHLQNLLYGLQYDTCCWAVRMVGGRSFIGLEPNNPNNQPQYKNEFFIQFSLKGLGDIGNGDPMELLKTITGYNSHFGQEF